MARVTEVTYEFVDSAPAELQRGTLYISTKYRAIVHLCLCGCGEKVLLTLDPESWSFTFDGRSVSIHDSVGNVGLPCKSHYVVRRSQVKWLSPLVGVNPDVTLLGTRAHAPTPSTEQSQPWFADRLARVRCVFRRKAN